MQQTNNLHTNLAGINVLPIDIDKALEIVSLYIGKKKGDYFCFVNAHLIVEGNRKIEIKQALNSASANFPDGMGVALGLKFLGHKFKGRVRGTDFMLKLCNYAGKKGLTIFLYGSSEDNLILLDRKLLSLFPNIKIVGKISPPYRELSREEDERYINQINKSNADILFVSLGAPKQEKWMYEHKDKIEPIQLGVGAAFDFITGNVKEAPILFQKLCLEWLFRFIQQPRKTIYRISLFPEFIIKIIIQKFKKNMFSKENI
jgi:N-acetylglucosaminyldiphosphoundecaprenol N-acetyl-beta-D-mannosaminyltransferase